MSVETRQIMLSLAYLAYCGDQITAPNPDVEIGDLIASGIKRIPPLCTNMADLGPVPNWAVVWGPVSYTTPGALYQDSLMYVVKYQEWSGIQPQKYQYVVAIRGTNHVSDLDWLMDDFDVLQQISWPPGSTNEAAMISESTSIALQVLLNMNSGGKSVLQYLSTVTESPVEICITGHSLGGCLASALGLYFTENVSDWDSSGSSTVSCVTFAAPTAGNTAFSLLIESAFSLSTFDRVACSLDIVPLAWSPSNLVNVGATNPTGYNWSAIFDIYYQNGSETSVDFVQMAWPDDIVWGDEILDSVLPTLQTNTFNPLAYTQPFASAEPIIGEFCSTDPSYYAYDQDFETTATAFGNQASYQHSSSYPIILNVPQLLDPSIINQIGSNGNSVSGARQAKSKFVRSLLAAVFNGA